MSVKYKWIDWLLNKFCSCFCDCHHCNCPEQTTPCEDECCEERRKNLSDSATFEPNSETFFQYYDEFVPSNEAGSICAALGPGWRTATVEELVNISYLFDCSPNSGEFTPCPTLVWATQDEQLVLVRVSPCNGDSVKVFENPCLIEKCLANTVCVFPL